jgi:hypothetical protein
MISALRLFLLARYRASMKITFSLLALICISTSAFAQGELKDLEGITFACPAAALNAAARAAKVLPTNGSYQFASFKILINSPQARYEVGFISNVGGEPAVIFEVSLYCQQGWNPNDTVKVVRR